MSYCRNLKFEETPNYGYLRRLFKELYNKCCFEHDFIVDWTVQRYRLDLPLLPTEDRSSTLPESLTAHMDHHSDNTGEKGAEQMHKARAADENEIDRVVELKGSKNPQDKDNE